MSEKQLGLLAASVDKQDAVSQATIAKKLALSPESIPAEELSFYDPDGVTWKGTSYRLDDPRPGYSYNAPERDTGKPLNTKQRKRTDTQKEDRAQSADLPAWLIPDQAVYNAEKSSRANIRAAVDKARSTKLNVYGKEKAFDRPLADLTTENGQSLVAAKNTPEENWNYNSKRNYLQKFDDLSELGKAKELRQESALFNSDTPLGSIGNALMGGVSGIANVAGNIVATPFEVGRYFNEQGLTDQDRSLSVSIRKKATIASKDNTYDFEGSLSPEELSHLTDPKDGGISRYNKVKMSENLTQSIQHITDFEKSVSDLVDSGDKDAAFQKGKDYYNLTIKPNWEQAGKNFEKGNTVDGIADLARAVQGIGFGLFNTITEHPEGIATTLTESLPHMIMASKKLFTAYISTFVDKAASARDGFVEEHGRLPEGQEVYTLFASEAAATALDVGGDRYVFGDHKGLFKSASAEFGAESLTSGFEQYGAKQDINKVDQAEMFASGVLGFGSGGATNVALNPVDTLKGALGVGGKAVSTITPPKIKAAAKEKADALKQQAKDRANLAEGDLSSLPPKNRIDYLIANTPKNASETPDNMDKHIDDIKGAIIEIHAGLNNELENPEATKEELDIHRKETAEYQTRAFAAIKKLKEVKIGSAIDVVIGAKESTPKSETAISSIIGSMDFDSTVSEEQAKKLLSSNLLSEDQKVKVESYIEKRKSMAEVSDNILNGGEGFLGINDHTSAVGLGVESNNSKATESTLIGFKAWAERHSNKASKLQDVLNALTTGDMNAAKKALDDANAIVVEGSTPFYYNPANIEPFTRLAKTVIFEANLLQDAFNEVKGKAVEAIPELSKSEKISLTVSHIGEQVKTSENTEEEVEVNTESIPSENSTTDTVTTPKPEGVEPVADTAVAEPVVEQNTSGGVKVDSNKIGKIIFDALPRVSREAKRIIIGKAITAIRNSNPKTVQEFNAAVQNLIDGLNHKGKSKGKDSVAYKHGVDLIESYGHQKLVSNSPISEKVVRSFKTSKDVVEYVMALSEDPILRGIAKKVLPIIGEGTEIVVKEHTKGEPKGKYSIDKNGKKSITIFLGKGNEIKGQNLNTILHEIVHEATVAVLNKKRPTKQEAEAIKELNTVMADILAYVSADTSIDIDSALSNTLKRGLASREEFITYSLFNQTFQGYLSKVPSEPKKLSYVDKIVKIFKGLLNLDEDASNFMLDAITASVNVIDTTAKSSLTKAGVLTLNNAHKFLTKDRFNNVSSSNQEFSDFNTVLSLMVENALVTDKQNRDEAEYMSDISEYILATYSGNTLPKSGLDPLIVSSIKRIFSPYSVGNSLTRDSREIDGISLKDLVKFKASTIMHTTKDALGNAHKEDTLSEQDKNNLKDINTFVKGLSKIIKEQIFNSKETAQSASKTEQTTYTDSKGKTRTITTPLGHIQNPLIYFMKAKQITSLRMDRKEDGTYEVIEYLRDNPDTNPEMDQNFYDSIGLAIVEWIKNDSQSTLENYAEDLKAILGLPDGIEPSDLAWEKIRFGGTVRTRLASDIGGKIAKILGMSQDNTADGSIYSKIEANLGLIAIDVLEREGHVKLSELPAALMEDMVGKEDSTDSSQLTIEELKKEEDKPPTILVKAAEGTYLAENSDEELQGLSTDLRRIKEAGTKSKEIIKTLFDVGHVTDVPVSELPTDKDVSQTLKGTLQDTSTTQREGLLKQSQVENKVFTKMVDMVNLIGRDAILAIIGNVTEDDLSQEHITRRKGIESNNKSLERGVDDFKAFQESLTADEIFYLLHNVWRSGRIGVNGKINNQTNKYMRWMFGPKSWEVEIDVKKNDEKLGQFKLAILESFGIKIEHLKNIEEVESKFREVYDKFSKNTNMGFVRLHAKKNSEESTSEGVDIIVEAVKDAGEGMHSFAGLIALREYHYAVSEDSKRSTKFTTTLSREIDGITNGVLIGLVLMGGGKNFDEMRPKLEAAGLFPDPTMDYQKWYNAVESGDIIHDDLYEGLTRDIINGKATAKKLITTPKSLIKDHPVHKHYTKLVSLSGNAQNAIDVIDTTFAIVGDIIADGTITKIGRKLFKYPLMITLFGASVNKVADALAEETIEKIYDLGMKAEDTSNNPAKQERLFTEVNDYIAILLGNTKTKIVNGSARDFTFTPTQVNILSGKVSAMYRGLLQESLEKNYGDFIRNRATFNSVFEVIQRTFDLMFEKKYAEKLKEINANKEGVTPILALSKEATIALVKSLRDFHPSLKHALSDENIETELSFLKGKYKPDYSETHTTQVQYASPHKPKRKFYQKSTETGMWEDFIKDDSVTSAVGHGTSYQLEDPGLSPTITLIHNTDSTVPISVFNARFEVLNVHDAMQGALDVVADMAETMNASLATSMFDHDVFGAALASLNRAIDSLDATDKKKIDNLIAGSGGSSLNPLSNYFLDSNGDGIFLSLEEYISSIQGVGEEVNLVTAEINDRVGKVANYSGMVGSNRGESTDSTSGHDSDVTNLIEEVNEGKPLTLEEYFDKLRKEHDLSDSTEPSQTVIASWMKGYDQLGSTDKAQPFDFKGEPTRKLTGANTESTFESLGKIDKQNSDSTAHTTHLRGVIHNLINKVITPLELYVQRTKEQNSGGFDPAYNRMAVNVSNTTSPTASGIQMSAQTVFVHELTHHITESALENKVENQLIINRITRLFNHVSDSLSEADRTKYAYIFDNQNHTEVKEVTALGSVATGTKNNGIKEFIAFGMSEPGFIKLLSEMDTPKSAKIFGDTISGTISNIFNLLMDLWQTKVKNNNGKVSTELDLLVAKLSTAHIKQSNILFRQFEITNGMDLKAAQIIRDTVLAPIHKFLSSQAVQNSKKKSISNIGKIAEKITKVSFKGFQRAVGDSLLLADITEKSLLRSLVTEAVGNTVDVAKYHTLLSKSKKFIDTLREEIATTVDKFLRESFVGGSVDAKTSVAITKVILKGDMEALFNLYEVEQIQDYLDNENKLNTQIQTVEDRLVTRTEGNYYINNSRSLGHFMVTGQHLIDGAGLHNVEQIAKQLSIRKGRTLEQDQKSLKEDLTRLSRLYALKYSSTAHKDLVAKSIKAEFAESKEENGILNTIKQHRDYKKDQLDRILGGNEILVVDGGIKENYNPHTSAVIATAIEGQKLLKQGFTRSANPIKGSKLDKSGVKYMYYSDVAGVDTYNKMIVSMTSKNSELSDIPTGYASVDGLRNYMGQQLISKLDRVALDKEVSKQRRSIIVDPQPSSFIPSFNRKGVFVGAKYAITEAEKDSILQKNNSFSNVLGSMSASISDKVNTEAINKEAVDIAYKDFKDNYAKNPNAFVDVSKTSKDPAYRETYNILPSEMKKYMKETWGTDGFLIRREVVSTFFGYRKLSITNWIRPSTDLEKINHKITRIIGDSLYKNLNFNKVKTVENVWQEVIKTTKDTIVIKNLSTLTGNIASNNWLLWLSGVDKADIYKYQAIGVVALQSYLKDSVKLGQLELRLKHNPNVAGIKSKINNLKHQIASNPVKPMVDSGIFQTIVEDIANDTELYTYKSKLDEIVEPLTNRVNSTVKEGVSQVAMTHDTQLYKFLRDSTQYSDFIARFALHQHNLKKGMSEADSLVDIVDSFINYDLPTHPLLQYGNDMGLIMFTKFFIRIQKVILKKVGKAPARFLGLQMLEMFTYNQADITDAIGTPDAIYNKFHFNPVTLITPIVSELPAVQATY